MPKGILGLPRPFAEYRVIINPHEQRVDIFKVGPFGGPRPFAKNNPPVEDERVAECMMSDAGRKFGAGVYSDGETTDIQELSDRGRQKALELAEKWCRGSLEAQAIEDMEQNESLPTLSRIRRTLSNRTGYEDEISIEMVGTAEEAEQAVNELA
jgi:hypothetical protein